MVALSKDLALGLVILAGVSVYLSQMSGKASYQRSDQVMTSQFSHFNREAAKFVQTNVPSIEQAIVSAGRPVSYNTASLQAAGYLKNFKTTNLFGQQFCLAVRRVGPGSLEALTATTGGIAIPPDRVSAIAADVRSGSGGSVQPEDVSVAVGGAWAITLADFTASGCSPTQGHLVGNLAFEEGRAVTSSYAHRLPVTGMPDSATFRQPITLDNACDDPTTSIIETNASCSLRASGQAANEPGFDLARIRAVNSFVGRVAVKGEGCDPGQAAYALSASDQALLCSSAGEWTAVPAQSNTVIWW